MSLTMPNWSLNSHAQSLAETMVGIAQGIRIAARTMARPLNSALRTSATIRPSTVSIETEMIAKRKVFQTAFHQAGSTRVPRQTVRPEFSVRQLR